MSKLGELAVIQKLTELGWDAFNLNATNPNYKGVDVVCIKPDNLETVFIQVKASAEEEPNFPTGLLSNRKGEIVKKENGKFEKYDLKDKIVGPWVFVHIFLENDRIVYKFYILTKDETVELIQDSNWWYWNKLEHRTVKDGQPIGLPISWISKEQGRKTNNPEGWRTYPGNNRIEKPDEAWEKIVKHKCQGAHIT